MDIALIIVLVVVLVIVIAAGGLAALRLSRTRRLRTRFGPEYDRVVTDAPNRGRAEEQLLERERRHAELELKPLSDGARERYIREWTAVQERFVDAPAASTRDADGLITELMRDRGYPVEDFGQRLADLSVEHAHTLEHYRTAHTISARISSDEAETEDMRQAMVHYRELFADLLTGEPTPAPTDTHAPTAHDATRPPAPRVSPETQPDAGPDTARPEAAPGAPGTTAGSGTAGPGPRAGRRLRDALRPRGREHDERDQRDAETKDERP
jgi:hypothetical protein